MDILEQDAIRQVLAGDTDLYRILMDRHLPAVLQMTYRITGRMEDAEEAAQEAFLRAYNKLPTFREHAAFGTRPLLGYTANFGYTRTTEQNTGYLCCSASTARFPIPNNVYELSVAYLVQKHITPKLTGFADLGGGMLTFLPVHRGATAANFVPDMYPSRVPSVLFRQLGVAGVGMDYHYTLRLALRVEYRGLLYKYPDFGNVVGRAVTVSSQPTLSLTYTFGKKRQGARALVH